jgi:transposase
VCGRTACTVRWGALETEPRPPRQRPTRPSSPHRHDLPLLRRHHRRNYPQEREKNQKSQTQALERTRPTLPLLPTTPARATHDYIRNGTVDLFAALDVATGRVHTQLHSRHRSAEFKKFLNHLNREVPDDLDVHLILDNYATHKTPEIHRWLLRHPRFELHFTPTGSSWLSLVERWFGELTTKKLRRSSHATVKALADDITAWTNAWNTNPTPYRWVKTADAILESIASYCQRTSNSGHYSNGNFVLTTLVAGSPPLAPPLRLSGEPVAPLFARRSVRGFPSGR